MMAVSERWTMTTQNTAMLDQGVDGQHQLWRTRTTEQEGRQGIDSYGMGRATTSASATSSAAMASVWAGSTSGSITPYKLHSNMFMSFCTLFNY
jgi:hypothetical protein